MRTRICGLVSLRKGFVKVNDDTKYEILAPGCDFVESKLVSDEHSDLKVIAAVEIPQPAPARPPIYSAI